MKILHTSDWHLGHSLYNHDRTEEQASMLEQMADLVQKEKPDAFLLSGDVFHTDQPSAAVQRMLADALVAIHNAHPAMTIVCTAGNHDSASRHEVFRLPWLSLNVHSIGQLSKDNPERHIISIPGKGFVVAVPYCYERNIPEGFFQQLLDRVQELNTLHLPVIMMAHTTMENSDLKGHDFKRSFTTGGIETMSISQTGRGYDYLALGHIHHAQWVKGGNHRVRYSGSPLPVSFDENYEHSVSIVSIDAQGDEPDLHTISIENPHPLVNLPSTGFARWEEAKELLKNFPSDIPAYIRLNIKHQDFLPPTAQDEAVKLTEGKRCRFCLINLEKVEREEADGETLTIQQFQEESPLEIARMFAEQEGKSFDEDLIELFNQAVNTLDEE